MILRPSTIKTTHPAQCCNRLFVGALPLDDVVPVRCNGLFFFFLVPILQCNSNDVTMKNASGKNDCAMGESKKEKDS